MPVTITTSEPKLAAAYETIDRAIPKKKVKKKKRKTSVGDTIADSLVSTIRR